MSALTIRPAGGRNSLEISNEEYGLTLLYNIEDWELYNIKGDKLIRNSDSLRGDDLLDRLWTSWLKEPNEATAFAIWDRLVELGQIC